MFVKTKYSYDLKSSKQNVLYSEEALRIESVLRRDENRLKFREEIADEGVH